MSWDDEFGKSYKVPSEILKLVKAGAIEDWSWHNDVAPSFAARVGDTAIRIWVEHPKESEREAAGFEKRFMVQRAGQGGIGEGTTIIDTDDPKKAVAAYLLEVAKLAVDSSSHSPGSSRDFGPRVSCPVCGGDVDDEGRCQQSCERGG